MVISPAENFMSFLWDDWRSHQRPLSPLLNRWCLFSSGPRPASPRRMRANRRPRSHVERNGGTAHLAPADPRNVHPEKTRPAHLSPLVEGEVRGLINLLSCSVNWR